MCTLIAFWRSVPGYGIVIGMNRDESSMRPADPPAVLDGTPMTVAPRDRQAGGTWLGGSGTGLVVALSHRPGRASPSARSRGQLVLDALRPPSVSGHMLPGRGESAFVSTSGAAEPCRRRSWL